VNDKKHPTHKTRFSDSSLYDEVCERCGAIDITGGGWHSLSEPCPGLEGCLVVEEEQIHDG